MARWGIRAATLALATLWACSISAQEAARTPRGQVDWVGGYVRGVGQGTARPSGNRVRDRLMAIRAAEVLAQRALAETIHGVRVDGTTALGSAMKEYLLESRVHGIVRGAQKVREEVTWDGEVPAATVELRICLVADAPECRPGASLMEAFPVGRRQEPAYVPAAYFEAVPEAAAPASASGAGAAASYDRARPVTGLVVKVDGIRFERELFPVVATHAGDGQLVTVFSAKRVDPEIIRTHGVARYADTVDQALKNPRLGDNPLIVSVSEVTRDNLLVLRPEAARAVRETTRYGNDYLAKAIVVIAGS